jgi:hypothetical protein
LLGELSSGRRRYLEQDGAWVAVCLEQLGDSKDLEFAAVFAFVWCATGYFGYAARRLI